MTRKNLILIVAMIIGLVLLLAPTSANAAGIHSGGDVVSENIEVTELVASVDLPAWATGRALVKYTWREGGPSPYCLWKTLWRSSGVRWDTKYARGGRTVEVGFREVFDLLNPDFFEKYPEGLGVPSGTELSLPLPPDWEVVQPATDTVGGDDGGDADLLALLNQSLESELAGANDVLARANERVVELEAKRLFWVLGSIGLAALAAILAAVLLTMIVRRADT